MTQFSRYAGDELDFNLSLKDTDGVDVNIDDLDELKVYARAGSTVLKFSRDGEPNYQVISRVTSTLYHMVVPAEWTKERVNQEVKFEGFIVQSGKETISRTLGSILFLDTNIKSEV